MFGHRADTDTLPACHSGEFNNEAGACLISAEERSNCDGDGLVWLDCVDFSYDNCENTPLQSVLQCSSNRWGSCNNQAECDAAGECIGTRTAAREGRGGALHTASERCCGRCLLTWTCGCRLPGPVDSFRQDRGRGLRAALRL